METDSAIKKVRMYEKIKTKSNSLSDSQVEKIAQNLLDSNKIGEPDSIKEAILNEIKRSGASANPSLSTGKNQIAKLDLVFKFKEFPAVFDKGGMAFFQFDIDGILFDVMIKMKTWNKFIENTQKFDFWLASLTGKLGQETNRGFVVDTPAFQVFERKPKPDQKSEDNSKIIPVPKKTAPHNPPPKKKKPTEPDCPQFKVKREYKPKFEIDRDFIQFSEYDYCRFVQIFGEDSFQFMKQTLKNPRAISVHWASQYMRVSDLLGRDKVESAESSYEITTKSEEWPKARNWRRVLSRAIDIK